MELKYKRKKEIILFTFILNYVILQCIIALKGKDKYELTHIRVYSEFNERLYLCYKMGKMLIP